MIDTRTIAIAGLALALVSLLAIIAHALIPTPPAHTADPFGLGR